MEVGGALCRFVTPAAGFELLSAVVELGVDGVGASGGFDDVSNGSVGVREVNPDASDQLVFWGNVSLVRVLERRGMELVWIGSFDDACSRLQRSSICGGMGL